MFRDRDLGRVFENGQVIVSQGESGDCMYVILHGAVEVLRTEGGREIPLTVLGAGDVFGEMALFGGEPRSATVRAKGEARLLTVDKRGFLKRVHQDPSLAFRILRNLSERIRTLDEEVTRLHLSRNP